MEQLTVQERNRLAKAERRVQAIAQSRAAGIQNIADAKAKLAEAERDAVERGDLRSKTLAEARRELADQESTQRVMEEFLENALNDLADERRQIWATDRDRLTDTWISALKATSRAVEAAIQAIEKQRAIEQEAHRVLGDGTIPAVGGGNALSKLKLYAETVAGALEKHAGQAVGR